MDLTAENNRQPKRRMNYRKRNRNLFFAALVAWPILQFCICYVYVNFNSFILAFKEYKTVDGALGFEITFAGFENFRQAIDIISERTYMFGHSFKLFFWTTIVGLTLALLFSYYIYKKYPMGGLFRVILFMPKILSGVVFSLLFKYLANDVYVYVAETFFHVEEAMGLMDNPDTKLGTVLFFSVWIGFGVNVLMFSNGMSGIDESIVESAQLDGVNAIQEFIHITVPMIWPTFVSFLVINFTGLFTDQMHLHTLYGNNGFDLATFGYYLYVKSAAGELVATGKNPSFSVLSAMGLMMTAVMLPLTLGLRKALRKFGPSVD